MQPPRNPERARAAMSARVGRNILLVQGAGGNSSIKDGDVLWVKASGTWLADAEDKEIFVPVSLVGRARGAGCSATNACRSRPGVPKRRSRLDRDLAACADAPSGSCCMSIPSTPSRGRSERMPGTNWSPGDCDGLAWRWLDYHHPGLAARAARSARVDRTGCGRYPDPRQSRPGGRRRDLRGRGSIGGRGRDAPGPGAARAPAADHDALRTIRAGSNYRLPRGSARPRHCHRPLQSRDRDQGLALP